MKSAKQVIVIVVAILIAFAIVVGIIQYRDKKHFEKLWGGKEQIEEMQKRADDWQKKMQKMSE